VAWIGFGIAVTGGFLLFSASAPVFLQNPAFDVKLPLVLLGIAFHVVIQRKARRWDQLANVPLQAKLAVFLELAFWLGVITAAVEIPSY
jgi:uncharacterized membrane protein